MQRYTTTGDWREIDGQITVTVSEMGNKDYEFCIGIHETIEAKLCMAAGVEEHNVTEFDMRYEAARGGPGWEDVEQGVMAGCGCPVTGTSEPGDDIHAPYYKQHQLATSVERMVAAELGVSWNDYEAANLKLYEDDNA